MRLQAVVAVGFTLLLAALPATAQWKWKDARGQVVDQRCPAAARDSRTATCCKSPSVVTRRAAAARAGWPAPRHGVGGQGQGRSRTRARRKKKSEQEQSDKVKAEEDKVAAQRAENCRRARAHMATLDSGIRLSRTNEKGEREILDDKQRADEMNRTRQIIAADCRAS